MRDVFWKISACSLLFCLILWLQVSHASETHSQKTVLVTGGLSGIGYEIAKAYQSQGWNVWVTSRHPERYPNKEDFKVLKMDLVQSHSMEASVAKLLDDLGEQNTLDVLVNNAGYGLLGAQENISEQEAQEQLQVNVLAPLKLSQLVLPKMRQQGHGHIINISSTSGIRAVPGLGFYAASKMALEGLSEALAAETAQWNIRVSLVEPGTVKNNWAANAVTSQNRSQVKAYETLQQNLQKLLVSKAASGQAQAEIGQLVVQLSQHNNPSLRYQTNQQANDVANSVYLDPTGNKMAQTMTAFASSLYAS